MSRDLVFTNHEKVQCLFAANKSPIAITGDFCQGLAKLHDQPPPPHMPLPIFAVLDGVLAQAVAVVH